MITDDQILEILLNPRKATKNNVVCDCPFCGKQQHMYVKLSTQDIDRYGINKSFNFDCKHCGEHGRIFKLLQVLEATHLMEGDLVDIQKELDIHLLDVVQRDAEVELNIDLPTIKFPVGFKRTYTNKYLEGRGFTDTDFRNDVIGNTDLVFKLDGYIVIGIYRDDELKAYLARTVLTKAEIKVIEDGFRAQGSKKRYPRYRNSETEFSKLLGGYDELNPLTNTVILVEGYFDKKNTDHKLGLYDQNEIKCCFTFGKKISPEQVFLLLRKGIEHIILLYDPDAIRDMKKTSFVLNKHFNVLVGYLRNGKDPGDATDEDFAWTMEHLEEPWSFANSKVQLLQL